MVIVIIIVVIIIIIIIIAVMLLLLQGGIEQCGHGCLYRLDTDPEERHNLATNEPVRIAVH